MSSIINASNSKTWNALKDKLNNVEFERRKTGAIKVTFNGEKVLWLPSYPKLDYVNLIRETEKITRFDVPNGFVAQWKANGSNIRFINLQDNLLAFTRGGYILEWRPYEMIKKTGLADLLMDTSKGGRYLLFGELVGSKSLVRICPNWWDEYLGAPIDYILFDVYDVITGKFVDLNTVRNLAVKHGLRYSPTQWKWNSEQLLKLADEFLETCNGEVWEGFIFKNVYRGSPMDIASKTFKWRLDMTKGYVERILEKRNTGKLEWDIFNALRKFIFEGYLDPPLTIEAESKSLSALRNTIIELISVAKSKLSEREKTEKQLKKSLLILTNQLLAINRGDGKKLKKSIWEATKLFIKTTVYAI